VGLLTEEAKIMLKHTATVPAHKHKQLLQETKELEEELFNTLHDLVVLTLKFNKLAALSPHIDPDSITVDDGEVINEFKRLELTD
jgi:hypothetical protein